VAYDDVKEFEGETYSGMAVGGEHTWLYPNGLWKETKVAPDRWDFTFNSIKERERSAPPGSGVPVGTQYHWYLLADQRVRKIDADSYTTFMSGVKYKIAHKRPHWRKWSSEYPEQASETEKLIDILEGTLARLREPVSGPSPVSAIQSAARPNAPPQTFEISLDFDQAVRVAVPISEHGRVVTLEFLHVAGHPAFQPVRFPTVV